MLELADKDFKRRKRWINKQMKNGKFHQRIEVLKYDLNYKKKNQWTFNNYNSQSRALTAEHRIGELEGRSMENTQTEAQRMKTEKHGTCSKVLMYLEFPKEEREWGRSKVQRDNDLEFSRTDERHQPMNSRGPANPRQKNKAMINSRKILGCITKGIQSNDISCLESEWHWPNLITQPSILI